MSLWRQLDIFRDWTPPPPLAPRPAPRQPRRDLAERSMDQALHKRPDPVAVYKQSISHGFDSCRGRWWYCSRSDLGRLIAQGAAITKGRRSDKARRALTPEQEADIVRRSRSSAASPTPRPPSRSTKAWSAPSSEKGVATRAPPPGRPPTVPPRPSASPHGSPGGQRERPDNRRRPGRALTGGAGTTAARRHLPPRQASTGRSCAKSSPAAASPAPAILAALALARCRAIRQPPEEA